MAEIRGVPRGACRDPDHRLGRPACDHAEPVVAGGNLQRRDGPWWAGSLYGQSDRVQRAWPATVTRAAPGRRVRRDVRGGAWTAAHLRQAHARAQLPVGAGTTTS